MRLKKGEATFNRLYYKYKFRSMIKQRDFLLSKEDFKKLTSSVCFYCNKKPSKSFSKDYDRYNGSYKYNGIDRIDNNKGYEIGNCVTCCSICNKMKSVHSFKHFKKQIFNIYKTLIRRKNARSK